MRKTMASVLVVAVLLAVSSVFCTYLPSSKPIPTVPSGQLDETMVALQKLALAQSSASAKPTGSFATASISGKLSYPGETIPPMRVVAFEIKTGAHFTATLHSSGLYQIVHLPAGVYQVVAYPISKAGISALSGGYSQAVPCGLSVNCTDHSLISITVADGAKVIGIDPDDFYAPAGTFPPDPGS
jgi:hypothetical protein